jgi:hypothetical protein
MHKVKVFLCFSLILISGFSYSQKKNKGKILWTKDYQLQWKDFTGSTHPGEGIQAWTSSTIASEFEKDGNFHIYCFFDKKKSWRIKKEESDALLRHEQYHFNLTELYTRKIRKALKEKNIKAGSREFQKIFKEYFREGDKAQIKYDKDTKHSKTISEQSRWETEIDNELLELDEFGDTDVDITD